VPVPAMPHLRCAQKLAHAPRCVPRTQDSGTLRAPAHGMTQVPGGALGWIEVEWDGLGWTGMDWDGFRWIEVEWGEMGWIEVDRGGLRCSGED
jgi:hypothetical protein